MTDDANSAPAKAPLAGAPAKAEPAPARQAPRAAAEPGDAPPAERPELALLRAIRSRALVAARQLDLNALGQAVHDLAALFEDLMRLAQG